MPGATGEVGPGAEEAVLGTLEGHESAALPGGCPDPDGGWPRLELEESVPVEPFPVDVFPARVAGFARAAAESIGCPADFVGLGVVVVAGAAIGRSAALRLKPDYVASASLYGLNVGGPAAGKSPALDACVGALWRIDERLHNEFRAGRRKFHEISRQGIYAFAKWQHQILASSPPALQSAVLDDSTVEAVARLAALNPRGLLVSRDDASAWFLAVGQGRRGRSPYRQFWLSALSGKPMRVDRKGDADAEPVRVANPFLSVLGNITPDVLGELRGPRGAAEGFLERILFAFPDHRPRPHWSDEGIPVGALGAWAEIVGRLRARPLKASDAGPHPETVELSPEARAAWVAWYNDRVDEMNAPGVDAAAVAAEGKLVDLTGRLALVLHLLHLASDATRGESEPIPPVPRWVAEGAFRLGRYFRSQHRRVRRHASGAIGNPVARSVVDWIQRHGRDHFSVKHLSDDVRWLSGRPSDRDQALLWLEDRHAIRRRAEAGHPDGRPGRRPSPVYDVHPALVPR